MRKLTTKHFPVFTRVDGVKIRAFLATAALGNSQAQKVPYRMLVVRAPIIVEVGDLINTDNGEKILLLDHPSDNSWTRNFKAAYARTAFSWKRPMTVEDPVTGFKREGVPVDMGLLYVNFDTPIEETTLTMSETEYRFLTGEDVRVRDIVDGKIVEKVNRVLGVNLVYAS